MSRKIARHRTLWISDVHLGSPNSKAKRLIAFFRQHQAERLYLVGDIFDGWKLKTNFHWTAEQSQVISAVMTMALRGTEVCYITGNHDGFLRQFVRRPLRFGPIRLVNEAVHTTADRRRLLVLHGDAFDDVVGAFPRLSHAADRAYETLISVNRRWNQTATWLGLKQSSLSVTTKSRVKNAVQYLSGFDQQVLNRCKQDGLHGVVCGHTHHAEMRELNGGITSYNCGDWVESCTALAEDFDGRVSLLNGSAMPPAAARRVPRQSAAVPASF